MRTYKYSMQFAVDGVAIPDPAGFSGQTADQDLSAERDVTGKLKRSMIDNGEKVPTEMKYTNIDWDICKYILRQMKNKPQFRFTFPDPNADTPTRTGDFYVGNRKWDVVWAPDEGTWLVNLNFSVIEV